MRRLKIIVFTALIAFSAMAGWQAGYCYFANLQFQDDLHDIAAQLGTRVGYNGPVSDDDLRAQVMRKAEEYHIVLEDQQVTVRTSGAGFATTAYLAADYHVPVTVPGARFDMHFTPSSTKKAFSSN